MNKFETNSAEEYYSKQPNYHKPIYDVSSCLYTLENHARRELYDNNITFFIVPWKGIADNADAMYNYIEKKIGNKDLSYIFTTDFNIFWAQRSGNIFIGHNISYENKKILVKSFQEYFMNNFIWDKNDNTFIVLKLDRIRINYPNAEDNKSVILMMSIKRKNMDDIKFMQDQICKNGGKYIGIDHSKQFFYFEKQGDVKNLEITLDNSDKNYDYEWINGNLEDAKIMLGYKSDSSDEYNYFSNSDSDSDSEGDHDHDLLL
jgi:hypothetical protein